ncbi:MAG: hypothetical protein ACLFUV_05120 [Methanomassiliicoccales archaeon]
MEIVQLVADESQGVFQRVLLELVRRKIEVDRALVSKGDGRITMVLAISNSPGRDKTLYALRSIQDVREARYLDGPVRCTWDIGSEEDMAIEYQGS